MLALYGLDFLSMELLRQWPEFPYHVITFFVIMMPTAGYFDTGRIIIQTRSPSAYNLNIVMILTMSMGLKVIYYIYHRFAFSIFGQCVSQLSVATLLSFLKFKYSANQSVTEIPLLAENPSRTCNFGDFSRFFIISRARNFAEYLITLSIYFLAAFFVFLLFCRIFSEKVIVDLLGLTANLIESTVSLPMFVKIVIRGDINAVSVILVLQYIIGDMMKIGLFIITRTPWSFLVGGFCQLSIDTVIFLTFLRLTFASPKLEKETESEFEEPSEKVALETEEEGLKG
jgi:hypothetical protein